jgi:hypothetical protein
MVNDGMTMAVSIGKIVDDEAKRVINELETELQVWDVNA